MPQEFWTSAFGTRDRKRAGRYLMAKAISRPGHTMGICTAADSIEQGHNFLFTNSKGVGMAKAIRQDMP